MNYGEMKVLNNFGVKTPSHIIYNVRTMNIPSYKASIIVGAVILPAFPFISNYYYYLIYSVLLFVSVLFAIIDFKYIKKKHGTYWPSRFRKGDFKEIWFPAFKRGWVLLISAKLSDMFINIILNYV